jgi:long-chain acyl-CoA synthetase
MNILQKQINFFASQAEQKIALQDEQGQISYAQLKNLINSQDLQQTLFGNYHQGNKQENVQEQTHQFRQVIGLLMDNSPAWAIIDLAVLFQSSLLKKCLVPLPVFFSNTQLEHCINDAAIDLIVSDDPERLASLNIDFIDKSEFELSGKQLFVFRIAAQNPPIFEHNIVKITYTSGSTGTPKGVMLDEHTILNKLQALAHATRANEQDCALSLLPLSTLLENIAGLYIPLISGATSTLLSSKTVGLVGLSGIDAGCFLTSIKNTQPSAFILIPQLLMLLVKGCSEGFKLPASIRFIAVGGAPVSEKLLLQARQLNIPVYQGYGFSEAASVVTLNPLSNNRIPSVGKVLNNHQLKISDDGEILVKNDLYSGYLGKDLIVDNKKFYHSGDIGYLDDEGYLYITGRKSNLINSSYGRNISPEWLEKELEILPFIGQVVVFGHAKPFLIAIIVASITAANSDTSNDNGTYQSELDTSLGKLNQTLPDYAQVNHFIIAQEPFSIDNQQLTATGRPIRNRIFQCYQQQINQLYESIL